jgi:hypothetical protein
MVIAAWATLIVLRPAHVNSLNMSRSPTSMVAREASSCRCLSAEHHNPIYLSFLCNEATEATA